MSFVCCACQQCIGDRLVYECDSRHFHKSCLKCQICGAAFQHKLYAINGLLVCREDYTQLRSLCHVCRTPIDANDYRFETHNRLSVHTKCMSCASCLSPLNRGDKYVLSADQRLVCHKCSQFAPQTPPPSRRGRKRQNNH